MLRDPVKFLLVDDVPANLEALEALLRRDGLEFKTARSGREALELLLVNDFALAMLDVQLPEMDGFELAEIMRGTERTRRVPIIFLTAVATDERRRFLGYESGAVDYLIKPIDPHVLRRKAEVFFDLDQQRGELIRQRDDLRNSEERFRRSVVQAPTPMMLFDDHGRVLVMNDEWSSISGYDEADLPTIHSWMAQAHGEKAELVRTHLETTIRTMQRSRGEFEIITKDGDVRIWDLSVSALGLTPDRRNLFLWVAHDITSRKEAERTQQLLMGELNHRVKNTLATVQAIAQQTLRRSGNPAEFAASFSGRIQALSRAHSILSDEIWEGASVKDLILDQLSLGAIDERRISITGPPVRLAPQLALHVALMLHELATNANKYGALTTPGGHISVEWTADDKHLNLRWAESRGPPVEKPARHGFGTTLIEQSAKADGGSAVVSYDRAGISWTICLPLHRGAFLTEAGPQPATRKTLPQRSRNSGSSAALTGKCILVVEDEPLVALEVVAGLEQAGAKVAGPAGTTAEALHIIASVPLDAALVDGNLHGQPVDAIAVALTERKVPFTFVTGYGPESLPHEFQTVRILGKPFTEAQLLDAAGQLVTDTPTVARRSH